MVFKKLNGRVTGAKCKDITWPEPLAKDFLEDLLWKFEVGRLRVFFLAFFKVEIAAKANIVGMVLEALLDLSKQAGQPHNGCQNCLEELFEAAFVTLCACLMHVRGVVRSEGLRLKY